MFGHLPVVKQLLAAGSDIKLKNQDGLTAVQVARQSKYVMVVDYLKEREDYVNACKVNGKYK